MTRAEPVLGSQLVIIMTMPCTSMAPAMAQRYHGSGELAARAVCLSSLLSIATLPLIALLL